MQSGKTSIGGLSRNEKAGIITKAGHAAFNLLSRGHWGANCQAPVLMTDPEKLTHFLKRNQLPLPRGFARGNVSHKIVRCYEKMLKFYQFDKEFLSSLDSLFFGGGERWAVEWDNLVVNEGLDHILDVVLSGGTQDTTWFVGLLGSSPTPAAGWTAGSLAAVDFVDYDESVLQAFVDGGVSSQSVSNAASTADFTISTNSSTIGGAFLIGTDTKATPAGTLYSAGAFTGGNKAADDNDTLQVQATFTQAAA